MEQLTTPSHAKFNAATLPAILADAGPGVRFVWEEFFEARISNPHTRRAYLRAVSAFLNFCHEQHVQFQDIMPSQVGYYIRSLEGAPASRKVVLAALRHFFDVCVERHVMMLNPAATVRGERFSVVEGKTPGISSEQVRRIVSSIDLSTAVGLRDRAVIATLAFTAARIGAVSRLDVRDFYDVGSQYCLHFEDKGGKSREIPVRHDLQLYLCEYLAVRSDSDPASPLFLSAVNRSGTLSASRLQTNDLAKMVKRRIRLAGLPDRLSAHSFRVAVATDLLEQGVPLEDVQRLLGHADARTTRLYDRRDRQVTRNIVERISFGLETVL